MDYFKSVYKSRIWRNEQYTWIYGNNIHVCVYLFGDNFTITETVNILIIEPYMYWHWQMTDDIDRWHWQMTELPLDTFGSYTFVYLRKRDFSQLCINIFLQLFFQVWILWGKGFFFKNVIYKISRIFPQFCLKPY